MPFVEYLAYCGNTPPMHHHQHRNQDPCSICCDQFAVDDVCQQMPCNHLFHKECLTKWLVQSNVCPVCRYAPDNAN